MSFDAFVAEIDPTQSGAASEVFGTYLGGSGADAGRTIAVDAAGLVYVAGSTYSFDFPLSRTPTSREIMTMAMVSSLY